MNHMGKLVRNKRYKEGSLAHNYALEKGAERANMLRGAMLAEGELRTSNEYKVTCATTIHVHVIIDMDDDDVEKAHVPGYALWLKDYIPDWTLHTKRQLILAEPGTAERAELCKSHRMMKAGVGVEQVLNVSPYTRHDSLVMVQGWYICISSSVWPIFC